MKFVYFDSFVSYDIKQIGKMYGYPPDRLVKLNEEKAWDSYADRFEKTFLANLVPNETYIFILVSPPEGTTPHAVNHAPYIKFQSYLKEFAMEPYITFQSPTVFMNRNVDKCVPRLRLYAFKFDEKYVEFAKGFVK